MYKKKKNMFNYLFFFFNNIFFSFFVYNKNRYLMHKILEHEKTSSFFDAETFCLQNEIIYKKFRKNVFNYSSEFLDVKTGA